MEGKFPITSIWESDFTPKKPLTSWIQFGYLQGSKPTQPKMACLKFLVAESVIWPVLSDEQMSENSKI